MIAEGLLADAMLMPDLKRLCLMKSMRAVGMIAYLSSGGSRF